MWFMSLKSKAQLDLQRARPVTCCELMLEQLAKRSPNLRASSCCSNGWSSFGRRINADDDELAALTLRA
jgi:hypothetical protein